MAGFELGGPRARPLVMGVVNRTPDSFSDGGKAYALDAALARAERLIAEGADLLDIGGESTRPGAEPVSVEDEIDRVAPLIRALRRTSSIPISVDTLKPEAAEAAIRAGADIWNDVTALGAPDALATAARLGCSVILMHMQGEPRTMQDDPRYEDVEREVADYLVARAEAAVAAGVDRTCILIDPGIGFGKTLAHNLALIAGLPRLVRTGWPVLLAPSRKRFIAAIDSDRAPEFTAPDQRLGGTIASILAGADAGCAMVRVHDVSATVQALKVWSAIRSARTNDGEER